MVETEDKKKVKTIRPQPGYQEAFSSSVADIVIGGGAAGVGKTFSLAVEPLYDIEKPNFRTIFFRRKLVELGPLLVEADKIYPNVKPSPTFSEAKLRYDFPSGATINFGHLQYDKDAKNHQGQEYALICFDELTHFTYTQFMYLLSRNRSTSGAHSRIRATCNPEPDSWVAKLIDWWIGEDGFPIKERAGVLRYFIANGDKISDFIWGDTKEEVEEKGCAILDKLVSKSEGDVSASDFIKSITFIPGSIYENKVLLKSDPGYLGSLAAQSEADRAALLEGNWKIKTGGDALVSYDTMDDMFNRYPQRNGRVCISSDVAGKGSDRMVVKVFDGFHLIDFVVVARSNGKQIVDAILGMMRRYHVSASNVVFDANGVGSHIDGYIPNAIEYKSQAPPLNGEYYFNLKAQCSQRWADRMNGNLIQSTEDDKLKYSIDRSLVNRIIDGKTLYEHYQHERKAIKLDPISVDGKPRIIKKSEMIALNGNSPDFIETDIMLELLYLNTQTYSGNLIW